jgi:hypothetical protein
MDNDLRSYAGALGGWWQLNVLNGPHAQLYSELGVRGRPLIRDLPALKQ